ncbi:peptidoglycan binding protein CsiV [Agarivorans sp.]|uniref:peptidoglycan binding protein CsiV n=1 Tax=Agarivorans sp. TaxID=1872412 RepID=UPI003D03C0E8
MRLILKNALQLCSLAAITLTSIPSFAEEPRWFDVEVIFFKRNIDVASTQEYWPQPQQISVNTSEPLLGPLFACEQPCVSPRFDQLPVTIDGRGWPVSGSTKRRILSKSQLELSDEFAKLQQHAGFTPLLHIGWREVVAPRNRAKHYTVQAGKDFSTRFNSDGQLLSASAPQAADAIDLSAENLSLFDLEEAATEQTAPETSALWELEGGFRVYLQHYLYIESELILKRPVEVEQALTAEPVEPLAVVETTTNETLEQVNVPANVTVAEVVDPNAEAPAVVVVTPDMQTSEQGALVKEFHTVEQLHSFKFDQKRRVRSGEIHYFDHPLMGMLVQIRRSPEAETQAELLEQPTNSALEQSIELSEASTLPEATGEETALSELQ